MYLISSTNGKLVDQTKHLKNVYLLESMVWEVKPQNIFLEIKNFIAVFKIMRELKSKHELLIVHTHTIKAGTIGRWAAFLAGIKIKIHTIHGFSFNLYQNKLIWLFFYLIELFNSMITTKFICVSSQDFQAGCEIFPNFKNKTQIIRAATIYPSYPNLNSSNLKSINNSQITIGTIACFKTGKNLFELLKAFKFAKKINPNLKLEIIGDGPLRLDLHNYLLANKLNPYIKLLGWQLDPIKYAKNWDLFVFSSLWEGLPCVIIELCDLKIPIISYNTGGICDLIPTSQLIMPGKWQDLALKMASFSKINVNLPNDNFYIPKMAQDHWQLYAKFKK